MRSSLALAALALAALLLLLSGEREPVASTIDSGGETPPVSVSLGKAEKGRTREPVGSTPDSELGESATTRSEPLTARDFLREYWGDQWEEVQRGMLGAGLDLDAPYIYHPWEDAERVLASAYRVDGALAQQLFDAVVDWEEEPSLHSFTEMARELHVPTARMPREEDLAALADIARPFNDELRRHAQEWVDGLRFAVEEKWRTGDFVRAPFATWGAPGASETGFYSSSHAALGWGTMLVLKRENYPYLTEIEDRTLDLRDQRSAEIRRYLVNR